MQLKINIVFANSIVYVTNVVLSVGVRSGTIKPLTDYIASAGGWMSWSADMFLRRPVRWTYRTMVKQPISWAYSKLFSGADEDEDVCRPKTSEQIAASLPDEQFVFVDLVKVYTLVHVNFTNKKCGCRVLLTVYPRPPLMTQVQHIVS